MPLYDDAPIIAQAARVRRITLIALRRALHLTGFCELCGSATDQAAFFAGGFVTEVCAACCGEANRRAE